LTVVGQIGSRYRHLGRSFERKNRRRENANFANRLNMIALFKSPARK
jgi:hypothetical protein